MGQDDGLIELQSDFLKEATFLLSETENSFLNLESNLESIDELQKIFRLYHSLKGAGAAVEFTSFSHFCHKVENLISPLVNKEYKVQKFHIDLLLTSNDYLKKYIDGLIHNRNFHLDTSDVENQITEILTKKSNVTSANDNSALDNMLFNEYHKDLLEGLEQLDKALVQIHEEKTSEENVNDVFRVFHNLKSTSGIVGFFALEAHCGKIENQLEIVRSDISKLNTELLKEIDETFNHLKTISDFLKNTSNFQLLRLHPTIDDILFQINQNIETNKQKLVSKQTDIQINPPTNEIKEDIKVDALRLDQLIDMIGELVIAETMVSHSPELKTIRNSVSFQKSISHLNKITRSLQEIGMSLRMIPVRTTFRKMNRIVRDVSRKLDKEIALHFIGEDTEVDKTLIDKINDPLVHMIRNAVDHGVEKNKDIRLQKGKSAEGHIWLRAYHKGSNIWIEVEDDGGGIDTQVVLSKAIKKNLVSKDAKLSDKEIFNLLFAPGFSTADKVTDVSGRGVGMDVVRKNIEEIRGSIEIDSQLGVGTKFTIKIPNTLAIIEGMTVTIGQERYVIPTHAIIRSIKISKDNVFSLSGTGNKAININHEVYPLIFLNEYFNIPTTDSSLENGIALIVEDGEQRAAFFVDRILRQQQFVIKSLGEYVKNTKGISGGTILGDGSVGLLIDVSEILKPFSKMKMSANKKSYENDLNMAI